MPSLGNWPWWAAGAIIALLLIGAAIGHAL
jgi:hypothetical protein